MTAIDIGSAATDRNSAAGATYTYIPLANTANASGKITSVELWFNTNATGVKVGTFSRSGAVFTPRSSASIGSVTAGSKQTFTGLNIDVVTGDYIGYYAASGGMDYSNSGGSGYYYKAGDQFGAGAQTYSTNGAELFDFSLYGTGLTGWANITKINGIASTDISKVDGIAVADISKVNGIAV